MYPYLNNYELSSCYPHFFRNIFSTVFILSQLQDFLVLDTSGNPDSLLWESLCGCSPVTAVHSDSVPLNCPLNNWIIYSLNTQQSKLCTRYSSTHWTYKQWTKMTQIPAYSELTYLLRLNLGWLWFHAFSVHLWLLAQPPIYDPSLSHLPLNAYTDFSLPWL